MGMDLIDSKYVVRLTVKQVNRGDRDLINYNILGTFKITFVYN